MSQGGVRPVHDDPGQTQPNPFVSHAGRRRIRGGVESIPSWGGCRLYRICNMEFLLDRCILVFYAVSICVK